MNKLTISIIKFNLYDLQMPNGISPTPYGICCYCGRYILRGSIMNFLDPLLKNMEIWTFGCPYHYDELKGGYILFKTIWNPKEKLGYLDKIEINFGRLQIIHLLHQNQTQITELTNSLHGQDKLIGSPNPNFIFQPLHDIIGKLKMYSIFL